MKRGLVLVEGQTEERVIRECLNPYLWRRGLNLTPTIVTTKRVVGAAPFKGGAVRFGQVQGDLKRLLHDTGAAVVTTMFDYYALPQDFPGLLSRPAGSARSRIEHVEATWAASIGDRRFVPHLVLHELEAWVYAAPSRLEPWMFDDDAAVIATIAATSAAHETPEDIDEGPETAPSKRLKKAFSAYQKTLHSLLAISATGIDLVRATCPHFAGWLERVEALVGAT